MKVEHRQTPHSRTSGASASGVFVFSDGLTDPIAPYGWIEIPSLERATVTLDARSTALEIARAPKEAGEPSISS